MDEKWDVGGGDGPGRLVRGEGDGTIRESIFTAWSGTTAVAAERLGRRWLAVEKELEYCSIAKRRLEGNG
jgi:hypothetical protein